MRRGTGVASLALGLALTAAPTAAPNASAGPAPERCIHPGVLVGGPQLDFAREKVLAGAQPWKAAYDQMVGGSTPR